MKRDEQVLRNLDLVEHFLGQALDDPSMLDTIPDGGTIVLLPADDPELADANLRTARDLAMAHPQFDHATGPGSSQDTTDGGVLLRATRP
jgi:hypothetical protein